MPGSFAGGTEGAVWLVPGAGDVGSERGRWLAVATVVLDWYRAAERKPGSDPPAGHGLTL